jgi:CheY-like chemotaxis protein
MSTIVIVEDDNEIRDILELVLVDALGNCTVLGVATGYAFIQLLKTTRPPDLILLDMRLPDASGVSLYNILRQDPYLGEVPVLFVTANPDLVRRAALTGPYACLAKPFDVDHFIDLVRSLLSTAVAQPLTA